MTRNVQFLDSGLPQNFTPAITPPAPAPPFPSPHPPSGEQLIVNSLWQLMAINMW